MIPFSEEELAYIARLDVAADIALLRAELPSLHQGCLRVLEISTTLLQRRLACWTCAKPLCTGGPVRAWPACNSPAHCRQLLNLSLYRCVHLLGVDTRMR